MSLSTDPRTEVSDAPSSPPATRHRAVRWRDPRLVVGVMLVTVSGLLGATLLSGADRTVGVWAARDDLAAGRTLSPADLVRREVAFEDDGAAAGYVSAERPPPAGTVLTRDVGAGELLPRAAVAGAEAPALVEVPLTVPAESVPATVRVGSVVDVWVTPSPDVAADEAAAESTLVFADVSVVAAPRGGGALGPSVTRQVIVGVDAGAQDTLPAALAELSRGSVVLVRKP